MLRLTTNFLVAIKPNYYDKTQSPSLKNLSAKVDNAARSHLNCSSFDFAPPIPNEESEEYKVWMSQLEELTNSLNENNQKTTIPKVRK